MKPEQGHRCDFIVFGGGHAGLAFAIEAARRGAQVVVVDRPRGRQKVGEVVEAALEAPLRRLGVWPAFLDQAHLRSSGTLSIWSGGEPQERSALVNPFGGGWFVDRPAFDSLLVNAACDAGVAFHTARTRAQAAEDRVSVVTDKGHISAPFAIEATGRHGAAVAPPARHSQDRLVALIAYVRLGQIDLRFRLEAEAEGWWYAAPLTRGRAVIALMTVPSVMPRDRDARRQFWLSALNRTTLLSAFRDVEPISTGVHPASGSIRDQLNGSRWLAVGDAGAAYDPLHGQGIVGALTKGIAAAHLLTSGAGMGCAVREYVQCERATFASYDRQRRALYREAAASRPTQFWNEVAGGQNILSVKSRPAGASPAAAGATAVILHRVAQSDRDRLWMPREDSNLD